MGHNHRTFDELKLTLINTGYLQQPYIKDTSGMDLHDKGTYLVTADNRDNVQDILKKKPEDAEIAEQKVQEPEEPFDQFLNPFLVETIGRGQTTKYHKGGANWHRAKGGGQIKLYFTDIQTIDTFRRRFGAFPQYIIVAGAAPGTHYLDLVMLFPPSIQWHFYDTEAFHKDFDTEMKSMSNVFLHKMHYTRDECAKWAQYRSTLFLSDIRTTTHHVLVDKIKNLEFVLKQYYPTSREKKEWRLKKEQLKKGVEELILKDMQLQQQMVQDTGAVLASIKFRLPWPGVDSSISEDYVGLQGYLLEQVQNRPNSTEGRLLVFCDNADDIYNGLKNSGTNPADAEVIYIPFSKEHEPKRPGFKNRTDTWSLQIRPDPSRQKATFSTRHYNIVQYEEMFAHINRNVRPEWDKTALKTVMKTLQDLLQVPLDEEAVTALPQSHQRPPSLQGTEGSQYWVPVACNAAVDIWKFSLSDDASERLSRRSGCSVDEPLKTEIEGFKQAHELYRDMQSYINTIDSLFSKFWPFEHKREHLLVKPFEKRNLLCVLDFHLCVYYYFDFDGDGLWTNLYCVKAKYESCRGKCDRRFFKLLGPEYEFNTQQPDTGAATVATYLLHTRPHFNPDDTPEINQSNYETYFQPRDSAAVPSPAAGADDA